MWLVGGSYFIYMRTPPTHYYLEASGSGLIHKLTIIYHMPCKTFKAHIFNNTIAPWYMGDCAKCLLNDHSRSTNILTFKMNSKEIHLSFKSYEESGHGVD
jgi:hypothetical protein